MADSQGRGPQLTAHLLGAAPLGAEGDVVDMHVEAGLGALQRQAPHGGQQEQLELVGGSATASDDGVVARAERLGRDAP
eukprot:6373342-Lingulodinium_polyedra.AAC.1